MALTFREFKDIISPYAGRTGVCPGAEEVNIFARQVMQFLLYSGSTSAIRKVCILACKGKISLPPEVEVPLKAKIDRRVAEVWSKWFTFHSGNEDLICPTPITSVMQEDGAETPLAYPLPDGGSVVGIMATCEENEDSFVDVQGKDPTGRVIYTTYNGENISGERFRLVKGDLRYGKVKFGEITGIVKPITNGYVVCSAVHNGQLGQFLADWSPMETKPMYKQWRVIARECPPIAHVSMLCRVKLRDNYHDNDLTLFDNDLAIMLAAQRINSEVNSDTQTALYKKTATEDILQREAGYKRSSCTQLDIYKPLSGGSIKNALGYRGYLRGVR